MKTNTEKTAITAAQSQLDAARTQVDTAAAELAAHQFAIEQNPALYGELVRRYTNARWKLLKRTDEGYCMFVLGGW